MRSTSRRAVHPSWIVAGVAFVALVGAAGFRSAPGALMEPLHMEFGWSTTTMSLAVGVNLVLYGLIAPFAAVLSLLVRRPRTPRVEPAPEPQVPQPVGR